MHTVSLECSCVRSQKPILPWEVQFMSSHVERSTCACASDLRWNEVPRLFYNHVAGMATTRLDALISLLCRLTASDCDVCWPHCEESSRADSNCV